MEPKIVHNESSRRYELYVNDELASLTEYRPTGETLVFNHTETKPAHQGRGYAERVVRFALDDVRSRGQHVVPSCWFVADVIKTHPEYAELVAA